MSGTKKIKVCLISCYREPDYIRARTLRAALGKMDEVELIVVKNTHKGLWRYPEVLGKIIATRIKHHPDIYFQTFRAYESFPLFRVVTIGKKFIFDEFINPIEQTAYENHTIKPGGIVAKIARLGYKFWLLTINTITTDTPSHARYSADLMKLPISKYASLIVSTDEQVFKDVKGRAKAKEDPFIVFYYGSMLRLQGVDTIIAAMGLLKGQSIQLVLIGGKEKTALQVEKAQSENFPIEYKRWVEFEELPSYIANADVCLGGPFGDSVQSQFVIGGKTYQFLQMGRPVIIGENEESHRWTDKKNALIVKQGDAQALADAILWAKNHPVELQEIANAGKELYTERLSNKVLVGELRTLLASERLR
jgi:glycosyltransferase involved in cell wall biosynthesis